MTAKERTFWKRIGWKGLVCGFVLAALGSFLPYGLACGELPRDVVRLHVVANSDSQEDQAVKLEVRDAVLKEAARWYGDAATMEEASSQLCAHLQTLTQTARETLAQEGMDYSATAQMTEMYFPTRDYGEFRLPAGRYRTLRVTLGTGEGKNWWCVVFPSLCLPAADEESALMTLPEGERRALEIGDGVEVKLKAVELWEALRELFRG